MRAFEGEQKRKVVMRDSKIMTLARNVGTLGTKQSISGRGHSQRFHPWSMGSGRQLERHV